MFPGQALYLMALEHTIAHVPNRNDIESRGHIYDYPYENHYDSNNGPYVVFSWRVIPSTRLTSVWMGI